MLPLLRRLSPPLVFSSDEGEKEEVPIHCDGSNKHYLKTYQTWENATKRCNYMFNPATITNTARKLTRFLLEVTNDVAVTTILNALGNLTQNRFNALKHEFIKEEEGKNAATLRNTDMSRTSKQKNMTTVELILCIKYMHS